MNASAPLQADVGEIDRFVSALFRYADAGSFVSLRSFHDDENRVFAIEAVQVSDELDQVSVAAAAHANRAAGHGRPIVFAPPIATFSNGRSAAEADLQNGLALSVECDEAPSAARLRLEGLLGPATVVVASGGEWLNPESGEFEPKLHLHWRLTEPSRDRASHTLLKTCRSLAMELVGADPTSKPTVHPMRWPGSWHRKRAARLARIVAEADAELDLHEAEERLKDAWAARPDRASERSANPDPGFAGASGESRDTAALIRAILTGSDFHAPIAALAMRYLKGGMSDAQVVLTLRGILDGVPAQLRDWKDGAEHTGRWQSRYDDIPRAVSTARKELGAPREGEASGIDVARFRLDAFTAGEPPTQRYLLKPTMPLGTVGLLYGPGGVGKSLAALDLCLTVAMRARAGSGGLDIAGPLGGVVPAEAAGSSLLLTLEDDRSEVHRRSAALDPLGKRVDAPCFVIPAVDLPDFDPSLVQPQGRAAELTAFATEGLDRLLESVARAAGHPVRLLVLDPAGDFLNADENDATFVKLLMRRLRAVAARHGCTIILLGHVAKAIEADGPSMRGSGAWVANSRFAYALWRPTADEADRLARRLDVPPGALVWGNLAKANHAAAPIGMKRLFMRHEQTGRLLDITARLSAGAIGEGELMKILVASCAEHAAAGMPFAYSGVAGLWNGRADLPDPLASLPKAKLEGLGTKALEHGLLVKTRTTQTQGAPKYLDVPDGPLARGDEVPLLQGSRREALARWKADDQT